MRLSKRFTYLTKKSDLQKSKSKQVIAFETKVASLVNAIAPEDASLFGEVLLLLKLSQASGAIQEISDLMNLLQKLKGNSVLHDWEDYIQKCTAYIAQNPPTDNVFGGKFKYIEDLLRVTNLAKFDNIDIKYLLSQLPDSTDLSQLNVYLAQAFITGFPDETELGEIPIFEFSIRLLEKNNALYPYVLAYEILDMHANDYNFGWKLGSFTHTIGILQENFNDQERFNSFFLELTNESYESYKERVDDVKRRSEYSFASDHFIHEAEAILQADENVIGLAEIRSRNYLLGNQLAGLSTLELVLVTHEKVADDINKMLSYAKKLGNFDTGFVGKHANESNVLACLYKSPFFRVDIRFITYDECDTIARRITKVHLDKDDKLDDKFSEREWKELDYRWYEERFWFGALDTLFEIEQGQYQNAAELLSYLRMVILKPLLNIEIFKLLYLIADVSALQQERKKLIDPLLTYDKETLVENLKNAIQLFHKVRSSFDKFEELKFVESMVEKKVKLFDKKVVTPPIDTAFLEELSKDFNLDD